uniref:Uncharacterized protein n=1 Tax=Nelumbo nucifera TaxID=4432 RepID=A0A822Z3P6_NELNU|nr:TPA_asm: hypothetical protein HUJ06_008746 [Nelumbo nucifera]
MIWDDNFALKFIVFPVQKPNALTVSLAWRSGSCPEDPGKRKMALHFIIFLASFSHTM